jgi:hypothetical protein
MSTEKKMDPISVLILVISILGIILMLVGDFAGFYLTGTATGNRYSCLLLCSYTTPVDFISQIFIVVLLLFQVILSFNKLIPSNFFADLRFFQVLWKYGLYVSILTILFAITGLISFGAVYSDYEWWPETGFYAGFIAGLLNAILFYLIKKQ